MDRPHHKFWPKRLPHSITVRRHLAVAQPGHQRRAATPTSPRWCSSAASSATANWRTQAERLAATLHALGVKQAATA